MKGFEILFSEQMENGPNSVDRQKAVFKTLYERFVRPNEETFQQNYKANCRLKNAVQYEECAFDFVPIENGTYFVLDREAGRLCGTFTAQPYEEDERVEKTFTSILIADYGDIRELLPIILQKRWQNIYIVLNKTLQGFASFFKLEEFPAVLPPNIKLFAATEDMCRYFLENPGAYLPRKVFSPEPEKYDAVIEELHDTRVRRGVPSDRVFLSICMPSFNRGDRALENVRHTLAAQYDAEIEIVLLNTGSTVRTEGYQEIKSITDSRLRYDALEENGKCYMSYWSALSRANGQFALMLSDEDLLAIENLGAILEYLYTHQTLGAVAFDAFFEEDESLSYLVREPEIYPKGTKGIKWAIDCVRYFSGTCFNCACLKRSNILPRIESYFGNPFVTNYIQSVCSAFLANEYEVSNSGIKGWYIGKAEAVSVDVDKLMDIGTWYLLPQMRIQQERGAMCILGDMLRGPDLDEIFDYMINATFSLISLEYKYKGKTFTCSSDRWDALFHWPSIWKDHYRNCLEILQELEERFGNFSVVKAKMDKSFLYWQICKREQRWHTAEENLMPSLQAQIIKFYHEKGVPFEKIDFEGIEKDLESWVQAFLAERS